MKRPSSAANSKLEPPVDQPAPPLIEATSPSRIQPHTQKHSQRASRVPRDDQFMRRFLTIWTAFLILLFLIVYIIIRDIRVLLGGTILAVAVGYVYAYYFRR